MAEKLPPQLLGKIFTYIAQSRPGRRRRGYSYEDTDSDSNEDEDEEYGDEDEEQYEEDAELMGLDYEEYDTPFNIADFEFYPTYALRPLILVCKAWKGIAERLLYASISLGSDGDDDLGGAVGVVQVSCLADTLEQTPRLALMVKKLRFSTMSCNKEESQNQAKIMVLCPNTTHITLHGYNGYVLSDFLKALTGLTYLRYLDISRYNLRDTECDGFCSFDKLLFMMMGWRDIETIIFHNNANAYDGLWWQDDKIDEEPAVSSDDEEEPDPDDQAGVWRHNIRAKDILDRRAKRLHNIPIRARILNPIAGACSKFKRFEWKRCFLLNPAQLHALSTIAPNLEESDQLSALHTEPERVALYDALGIWGETLTSYTCTPHSNGPPLVDDSLAQRLVRLRNLRTNGSFIGAEALTHLESLESLTFYRTGDNVDGLAAAVARMSSLRTLELRSMDELKTGYSSRDRKFPALKPESMDRLSSACEKHGVALSVKEYKW